MKTKVLWKDSREAHYFFKNEFKVGKAFQKIIKI